MTFTEAIRQFHATSQKWRREVAYTLPFPRVYHGRAVAQHNRRHCVTQWRALRSRFEEETVKRLAFLVLT